MRARWVEGRAGSERRHLLGALASLIGGLCLYPLARRGRVMGSEPAPASRLAVKPAGGSVKRQG